MPSDSRQPDDRQPDSRQPDSRVAAAVRFLLEVVAWVAAPWALAGHSIVLAILSVIVLIGLPTVFGTPGDKKQTIIAVPGVVTIGLVMLHMAVAVLAAWVAWPVPVAIAVTALAAVVPFTERTRWRRLMLRPATDSG